MHTNFLNMLTISLFYCSEKVFYSYEYMDNWEKFNETLLAEKEYFYSLLNMKDITVAHYPHAKSVRKDFEITNLGEYYDLHVQNDTYG